MRYTVAAPSIFQQAKKGTASMRLGLTEILLLLLIGALALL